MHPSTVGVAAGANPYSIATGDLNGDTHADLVVADRGPCCSGAGSGVSFLVGYGDGTFQTSVAYAPGTRPTSVAMADFDGSGAADGVIASTDFTVVSVLLGWAGHRTFKLGSRSTPEYGRYAKCPVAGAVFEGTRARRRCGHCGDSSSSVNIRWRSQGRTRSSAATSQSRSLAGSPVSL